MKNASVLKVSNSDQLQALFRQAQEQKIPVSLYRKPSPDGIVLDFSEWRDIEVFDIDNLMVIVPPGLLLKDLNTAAAAKGLRFIPADTPAFEQLSIGEWAYRGCPNPSFWKYSAGKHFLLGASYVFPNGDLAPVGGKCIKNVTGYDFTRFLTGAYADLAVGVQYIIRLMPQPAFRFRYDITINSMSRVTELISKLQAFSVPPAWLFWADETAGSKLFGYKQQGHRVLFELEGNQNEVQDFKFEVDSLVASVKAKAADDPAAIPDLSFLETHTDVFWLLDEFKVPYREAETFHDEFGRVLKECGIGGGLFGQLADGRFHTYIEQAHPEVRPVIAALEAKASALGGASSGKFARLYEETVTNPLAEMEAAFKKRIDPNMIFNSVRR